MGHAFLTYDVSYERLDFCNNFCILRLVETCLKWKTLWSARIPLQAGCTAYLHACSSGNMCSQGDPRLPLSVPRVAGLLRAAPLSVARVPQRRSNGSSHHHHGAVSFCQPGGRDAAAHCRTSSSSFRGHRRLPRCCSRSPAFASQAPHDLSSPPPWFCLASRFLIFLSPYLTATQ